MLCSYALYSLHLVVLAAHRNNRMICNLLQNATILLYPWRPNGVTALLCCCYVVLQSDEHRAEESGKRALKLRLSDGCQDVAAFEFRRLSDLKLADLTVGLKLIVTNPVSTL
jgi:RecQ mediated genome instability protein